MIAPIILLYSLACWFVAANINIAPNPKWSPRINGAINVLFWVVAPCSLPIYIFRYGLNSIGTSCDLTDEEMQEALNNKK